MTEEQKAWITDRIIPYSGKIPFKQKYSVTQKDRPFLHLVYSSAESKKEYVANE